MRSFYRASEFQLVEITPPIFAICLYLAIQVSTSLLDREQKYKVYKGRRSLSAQSSTLVPAKHKCFVLNMTKHSCESTSPTGKDSLALVCIATELTRLSSNGDNRRLKIGTMTTMTTKTIIFWDTKILGAISRD